MPSMINDLMKPTAYPENFKKIKFVQTHISTVFIGDEFVYKIKKPVNFGFLDFSTLGKRNYYCKQEVELNNRFSKGVYLGVYPVTFDGKKYSIDGKGEIVDYAVKMRRLSDEDLLKSRFKKGNVTNEDIGRIAAAIASFHKTSTRSKEIDEFGNIKTIKFNTDENFEQTAEFIDDSISKEQHNDLRNWTDNFYKEHEELFDRRIEEGKIRDCHGDLHMEHICLTDPIIIFDCIEFNNGHNLSEQLLKSYLTHIDEKNDDIYELIKFYKVYRAYVRGKVTSFTLKDSAVPEDKKTEAREIAKRYFALAHSFVSE